MDDKTGSLPFWEEILFFCMSLQNAAAPRLPFAKGSWLRSRLRVSCVDAGGSFVSGRQSAVPTQGLEGLQSSEGRIRLSGKSSPTGALIGSFSEIAPHPARRAT